MCIEHNTLCCSVGRSIDFFFVFAVFFLSSSSLHFALRSRSIRHDRVYESDRLAVLIVCDVWPCNGAPCITYIYLQMPCHVYMWVWISCTANTQIRRALHILFEKAFVVLMIIVYICIK